MSCLILFWNLLTMGLDKFKIIDYTVNHNG